MRHLGTAFGVVAVAALALLAVGCAGQPSGDPQTAPAINPAAGPPSRMRSAPGPGAPDMPSVHLPPGSVPVAGSRVDARSLPAGYPRLVWTEGNGATLGFFADQGKCQTVSAEVTAQTDTQVTVRLLQIQPATTKPCARTQFNKRMTVALNAPLGNRSVIMQAAIERG